MDGSVWRRAQAVFHDVADLPADQQPAAVRAACDGDDDLAALVLRLLQADRDSTPVLLDREVTAVAGVRTLVAGARADLDYICGRALHTDRGERYDSVDALLADLTAFGGGRPIAGRRSSPWYRAGRFVHRHRVRLLASMAAAVLLIAAVTYYVVTLSAARDAAAAEAMRTPARGRTGTPRRAGDPREGQPGPSRRPERRPVRPESPPRDRAPVTGRHWRMTDRVIGDC